MTNVLQAAHEARAKHAAEIERIDAFIAAYHEFSEPQRPAEQQGGDPFTPAANTVAAPVSCESAVSDLPETAHEHVPPSGSSEGQEVREHSPERELRADGSTSPLQRSLGVSATPPDSLQAKPEGSHSAGNNSDDVDDFGSGKSGTAAELPDELIKELTKKEQVRICHEQHPDWDAKQIGEKLSMSENSVRAFASHLKISLKQGRTEHLSKPRRTGMQQKFIDAYKEHPEWSDIEIADHIGSRPEYVRNAAGRLGVTLSSRSDAREKQAAQASKATPSKVKETPKPAPALSSAPLRDIQTRTTTKPKGTRFYLREQLGRGKFLHMTGEGLTDDRQYAWVGTESQLFACRKKFPDARDLVEEVVEK